MSAWSPPVCGANLSEPAAAGVGNAAFRAAGLSVLPGRTPMRMSRISFAPNHLGGNVDAFISHSSANQSVASKLEKALEAAGLQVWLDDSEITIGVLLGKELQDSIRASRVLILLWSSHAASSRWVRSEWLTAFHLNRYIVPCALDDTFLPQCLQGDTFLRIRQVTEPVVDSLLRAVR